MRFFAMVAAIIIFIIAALIAFFLNESDVTLRSILGIMSLGLAAVAVALIPPPTHG